MPGWLGIPASCQLFWYLSGLCAWQKWCSVISFIGGFPINYLFCLKWLDQCKMIRSSCANSDSFIHTIHSTNQLKKSSQKSHLHFNITKLTHTPTWNWIHNFTKRNMFLQFATEIKCIQSQIGPATKPHHKQNISDVTQSAFQNHHIQLQWHRTIS